MGWRWICLWMGDGMRRMADAGVVDLTREVQQEGRSWGRRLWWWRGPAVSGGRGGGDLDRGGRREVEIWIEERRWEVERERRTLERRWAVVRPKYLDLSCLSSLVSDRV